MNASSGGMRAGGDQGAAGQLSSGAGVKFGGRLVQLLDGSTGDSAGRN